MQHCDLVLIEGFKNGGFPKLEVWRESQAQAALWPHLPDIVGIACDGVFPVANATVPLLDLSDVAAIATFVQAQAVSR